GHLDCGEVLAHCRAADSVTQVIRSDRVLAAPLGERRAALEPLTALRELQHRVLVVELLGALDIGAGVLEQALQDLPDACLVSHSRSFFSIVLTPESAALGQIRRSRKLLRLGQTTQSDVPAFG